jgi:hypothetical protein
MDLAMVDARRATIALTTAENANYLFARKVKDEYRNCNVYAALETEETGVTADMLHGTDIHLAFGAEVHISLWSLAIRRDQVSFEIWLVEDGAGGPILPDAEERVLPMAFARGSRITLVDPTISLKKGDRVYLAILREHHEAACTWLQARGLTPWTARLITATHMPVATA